MKTLRFIPLLLSFFVLANCTTTSKTQSFNSLVIQNNTVGNITDVALSVPETGKLFSCSVIPRNGQCSIEFEETTNKNRDVLFSWKHDGHLYERDLRSSVSYFAESDYALSVVVNVEDNGIIETEILDDWPERLEDRWPNISYATHRNGNLSMHNIGNKGRLGSNLRNAR